MVFGDKNSSVQLAVWRPKSTATPMLIPKEMIGQVVVVDSVRVDTGSQDTTQLNSSSNSAIALAPPQVAQDITQRSAAKEDLTCMSQTFEGGHIDYSISDAQVVHSGALTSLLVPNIVRDLGGVVYEVCHCLVKDLAPIGETEELWYMGCTECKKKPARTTLVSHLSTSHLPPSPHWGTLHKPKGLEM